MSASLGRPSMLISRSLPTDAVTRARARADVDVNEADAPLPRNELIRRLQGREGLEERIDLDLVVRDIGDGVDGQPPQRHDPHDRRRQRQDDDQPAVLDGEVEEGFKHGRGLL